MTVCDLLAYLTHLTDHGKGDAIVTVANKNWNPIKESDDIADCLLIEHKDGCALVVLQTD